MTITAEMITFVSYIGNDAIWWKWTIFMIETRRGPTHGGAACEKMEKKTISSGVRGGVHWRRGNTFLYTGGRGWRVSKKRRREWTSLAKLSPSERPRVAFHAHFINSNLSSAENWIRLIRTIDARLRPRIQNEPRRWEWCTTVSYHLNERRRSIVSRHD